MRLIYNMFYIIGTETILSYISYYIKRMWTLIWHYIGI